MTTLDGNSIAGTLHELFGAEMTAAVGTCAGCGSHEPLAALRVYADAPGVVARCSLCESLLLVVVEKKGMACIDLSGFSALDPAPAH